MEAAINQRNNGSTLQRIVFVPYSEEDQGIFQGVLDELRTRYPDQRLNGIEIRRGDITYFGTHQCSTIVNAANMEVQFGEGLSGIIGDATGQREDINREAKDRIREYNQKVATILSGHRIPTE